MVAAVQALAQAYADYYGAIADADGANSGCIGRSDVLEGHCLQDRITLLARQVSDSLFFHRSVGIRAPLLPASHEDLDLRIAGHFQGKRLDRGASAGLSVTHSGPIWLYSTRPEKFPQLSGRLEASVVGQQFLPFQQLGTGDVSADFPSNFLACEFGLAAGIDDRDLARATDFFSESISSNRSAWNFGSNLTASIRDSVVSTGRFSCVQSCQPPSRMLTFCRPRYLSIHQTRAVLVKLPP